MAKGHKLSIIIPAYNEKKTIRRILSLVEKAPLPKDVSREIIIVDDGSSDGTREILSKLSKRYKVIFHKKNKGKGGAVKTGFKAATGDMIIIQDADLEYDPRDYVACIKPIIEGKAQVVYGSRRLRKANKQFSGLSFYLGGVALSWLTTMLYFNHITDEPTCYKTFRADVIKKLRIKGDKFEWEPEVTAKMLKQGIKIHEVPIRYYPRDVKQGKKIRWKDGVQAIWILIKYRFVD
jgi:glycosyltransferase involved in cell wall biosynthesis